MNLKLKIAANTSVQILGRFISSGVTFLVTILVARQFGVEGYGEFTKIMAYVAYFYLVADFGFNAVVMKEVSGQEKKADKFFSNLLGLRIAVAFTLILLALLALNLLPYDSLTGQGFSTLVKTGITIAALTILTQAIFTTANLLFQKNLRYDLSVLAASAGSVLILLLAFFFTSLGAPLQAIVISYVAGGFLMAGLALNFSHRFLPRIRPAFDFSLWRKIFRQTWPLGLTLVFNLVYFRLDMMMMALLRPNFEVGIYGLAYKFFEFPLAVATFAMNSTYPVMLWKVKKSEEELKKLIKTLIPALLIFSLLVSLIFIVLAPFLSFIRSDFGSSVMTLRILSLSYPLFFLSALFMWALIALGKQKLLVVFYGASMLLNILLNFIFIPRYGYLAAAVVTDVSEAVVLLLTGVATFSAFKAVLKADKKTTELI
ncbi:MAG: flippase [bacterium]|nr:flippase [bacterium]